ncbi:FAD:protein FMN transferase [Pseudocolwellia sp. AS88]|uniref:FAD:protein FMN transferase n=1 Tax=Pseudocolwellia sp. AS88 TaxID=3063958 RepID=UPI0026EEE485|nr:FAD:protein FMN transferase [Pseudocolwellia sp. AS88]MDO7086654.1 FAD:protein FMN transferase [Pseudocolwellia sp. AS88]
MKINTLERCKTLLGTFVEIELKGAVDDDELIALSNSLFDEIERIHNLFSFHSELSEISALNRQALDLANRAEDDEKPLTLTVSEDLNKVLSLALQLNQFTRGLYDITVAPSLILNEQLPNHLALTLVNRHCTLSLGNSCHITCKDGEVTITKPLCIDLGGIAKGYAVDCALKKVPEHIFCRINAGGDLAINQWKNEEVAVKYNKRGSALRTVKMQNRALATSGNYLRDKKSAFVNPLTGKHIKFKGSMSVFSADVMLSDALTKAMILSSRAQRRQLAKYYNAQAIKINRLGFVKLYY